MPQQNIEVSTDQVIFFFTVALIAIITLAVFFFLVIFSYFKANARRQEVLLRAMLETQEKERSRIALDMHDELGPLLSAVKLQVGSLKHVSGEQHTMQLHETQELLDGAITQIRQIIRDLVPKNIEQKGLTGVLQDLKQHVESIAPVRFVIRTDELGGRLGIQSEINIYRIVQEIVNNAVKHAGATEIRLSLTSTPDHLGLQIEDNGRGFMAGEHYEGSGLKNIQTRIQMNQGNYVLEAAPEKGTRYLITFEKKFLQ
ncbi:MAG: sensor histidine kinase [Chitinophagales bacterium]|nr:sensor histidine kinase [Chitinophagales bacterium]